MIGSTKEVIAALDPLLDQVLDLTPDEREIWFATLRLERPGLARELESLLEQESRLEARGFLEGDGYADLFDGSPSLGGRRIGGYTLEEPIGHGGMGSVWLARRSDGRFEGKAAVKLLNLALLDPVGVERFAREGTVLAQLAHSNIARLLDAGVSEAGQPYLVLEYVEGHRIDIYCDEHRLEPRSRLALFRQVLAAVAHAHAHLIVHRDLKPSNILVTSEGNVKLLDFGIAKLLEADAAGAERTELTKRGGLPLTPEYAAPEQVLGAPITTRTDVYSLGVLLYVLLAGRHPTSGGSLTAAGHLSGILDSEPPRLSTAVTGSGTANRDDAAQAAAARGTPVERLKRLYHGDLDNILAKALKKDPTHRYATVTALADDLERHLRHEPVQARADSLGYRARKFVRRNRAGVTVAAITVATLAAATVVTTAQMVEAQKQRLEAEEQRDEARVQRDRARYEGERATASAGFMQTLLNNVAPTGEAYTVRDLLDRARELLEIEYGSDPRFVARMMIELSAHYNELHDPPRETALLVRAVDLAAQANDSETVAMASCKLAYRGAYDGDTATARRRLEQAAQHLSSVSEPRTTTRMECLDARAELASQLGQRDSALNLAKEQVAVAEAAGDTNSHAYAGALNGLSIALQGDGKLPEALGVTRKAIAVMERIGRGSTLPMVVLRYTEAFYLAGLGEIRIADSALTQALVLAARMDSGEGVPSYMTILSAELAAELAQPDSAITRFERAVAAARRDKDTRSHIWSMTGLIAALIDRGAMPRARQRLDELRRAVSGGGQWRPVWMEARLASAQGQWPEAARRFRELLYSYGPPNRGITPRNLPNIHLQAARASIAGGETVGADSLVQRALTILRESGHEETRSGPLGYALFLHARIRQARGDSPAARELLDRAQQPLAYAYGPNHPRTKEARMLLDSLSP